MNKPINVGLARGNALCLITAFIALFLVECAFNARGQTLTTLWSFTGGSDGDWPNELVQGRDGNLYGTTQGGGNGKGTVFRLNLIGALTNLWSFTNGIDGGSPFGGLVQGTDGNFFGTTAEGGGGCTYCGTVFRISPDGDLTTLWAFTGNEASPESALVQGKDGDFFGTTCCGYTNHQGNVFQITPQGTLTTLYQFIGAPDDGAFPNGPLALDSDGYLYGTTYNGGNYGINSFDAGTVFRVGPYGNKTNLWLLTSTDGVQPVAGLVHGSDGNFYGTGYYGGKTNLNGGFGYGTVFRISPSGSLTNLWKFSGPPKDGAFPYSAKLVQGSDGNFYGTTGSGGTYNRGTIFRITPSGSLTILWSFNGSDGRNITVGLIQGSDGIFYGTTAEGGAYDRGSVFKLTIPLAPPPYPINQITGVQVAETNIVLNIVSIAGETYQLQFRDSLTSGDWSNVSNVAVTNSIGALLTLTNFGGALQPQGFYRFAITP